MTGTYRDRLLDAEVRLSRRERRARLKADHAHTAGDPFGYAYWLSVARTLNRRRVSLGRRAAVR